MVVYLTESLSGWRDNTEWRCDNLRRSFIPSQPVNTNGILDEILTPLSVLDGRGASEVQVRLVLVNSRSDPNSFERGRVLCRRVVASAAELAPI